MTIRALKPNFILHCNSFFVGLAYSLSRSLSRATTTATAGEHAPFVYYRYCSDVRAAGKAPLRAGQPGYAAHLDRDGDGIACESYRGY